MSPAKILFELSGSIAAWKACAVISRLAQDGHEVQVVATTAALRFVGAPTLEGLSGRPVRSDMWATGTAMDHINLVKWADLVVLCPATANTINRLAAGLADDLVGALFLAHDWRKPYLLAPAMNPAMWSHPATAASIERLRGWGVRVLPVARGRLACGDEGEGRLIEPDEILSQIRAALAELAGPVGPAPAKAASSNASDAARHPRAEIRDSVERSASAEPRPGRSPARQRNFARSREAVAASGDPTDAGAASNGQPATSHRQLRVLITSGGTEELIDGVRSLGNFSTGRTGALLAETFAARGHDVVLLRARRAARPAAGSALREEIFGSFAELAAALQRLLRDERFDAVVHAAAVGDYSLDAVTVDGAPLPLGAGKLDSGRDVRLHLRPNPKLIDRLREWSANPELRVVAFKLTNGATAADARAAVEKLFARARANFVVHNDLAEDRGGDAGNFPAAIWRATDGDPRRVESRAALADALERVLIGPTTAAAAGKPRE